MVSHLQRKRNFRNIFGSPGLGGLEFCLNQMALATVKLYHSERLPGGEEDHLQCGLQDFSETCASVAMHAALYDPHELFSFSKCRALLGRN